MLGLFGHTFVPDEGGEEGDRVVQYQFRIIRTLPADAYVVQYFSFLDGRPTDLGRMTGAELWGPNVTLYSTEGDWVWGYEKASDQARYRRERRKADLRVV
jgi:hypothetical protein